MSNVTCVTEPMNKQTNKQTKEQYKLAEDYRDMNLEFTKELQS